MASRSVPPSSEGVLSLELILARSRASDLESVKKLNVWHNKIKDISLLQSTPNLQVLNLSSNGISSLWPLRNSVALKELYLRRNALSSVSELLQLRRCGSLRFAWFAGNPLCDKYPSIKDYRIAVVRVLPQLSILDNIVITEEERILSQHSTTPMTVGNLLATEENKENLMDKSLATKEQLSASLEGERPRRALSDENNKNNCANRDEGNDFEEAEDEDDDDDAFIVDQTKSENNEFSDLDLLQSSQRFSVAECNSIRETLGLKPIVINDCDDDVTIDDDCMIDDDSGAIGEDGDDDEDDSGAIDDDDYDDDDLEMLNSYAEMLDDSGESFDRDIVEEEQDEEHSDSLTRGTGINEGFPSSDNLMNPPLSRCTTVGSGSPEGSPGTNGSRGTAGSKGSLGSKSNVGSESTFRGRATNNNSQGSLLSATLLLLQNLATEDLMEVERECERLRECHQRLEKDASLNHE